MSTWYLWSENSLHLVLDAQDEGVMAYLWDEEDGMINHVWLYNQINSGEINMLKSQFSMDLNNLRLSEYIVPRSINDVYCEYDTKIDKWSVGWNGDIFAELNKSTSPGKSKFVKNATKLACPYI